MEKDFWAAERIHIFVLRAVVAQNSCCCCECCLKAVLAHVNGGFTDNTQRRPSGNSLSRMQLADRYMSLKILPSLPFNFW